MILFTKCPVFQELHLHNDITMLRPWVAAVNVSKPLSIFWSSKVKGLEYIHFEDSLPQFTFIFLL
jgi:hypothetical protein